MFYRVLLAAVIGLGVLMLPSRRAQAQDSCSALHMTVSPCLTGEYHVANGGTATYTVTNYDVVEDAYTVDASCTGVARCSGTTYYSAAAGERATVAVPFTVAQPSGQGTVDAHIVGARNTGEITDVGTVDASSTVYGQAPLVIDSAQTPVTTGDQRAGLCAADCFAAGTSISTVPFFTLGEARNVTLVYTEERAHPTPFVYATVIPAEDAQAVSGYLFSATLNGVAATFSNGETTLHFSAPSVGNVPVRLGGQLTLNTGGPQIYDVVVNVTVQYADGSTAPLSYTTKLLVDQTSNSAVARGWTIANIDKLDCDWTAHWQGCMIYEGNGSIEYFRGSFPSYRGADSTTLAWDGSRYRRTFLDGSVESYDANGYLVASSDPVGRTTSYLYDASGRLSQIIDPRHSEQPSAPYLVFGYDANGLHTITETGGRGTPRTTTLTVDASRNLTAVTDPDGVASHIGYDGSNRLSTVTDRRGSTTTFRYDSFGRLASITAPPIPIDAGNGTTTTRTPVTLLGAWQGQGVPTAPTASNPPTAITTSAVMGTVVSPGADTTQFTVNPWGQALATVDPRDRWTIRTYDRMYPARTHYQNGAQDSVVYDSVGRPRLIQAAGDSATHIAYNSISQPDSVWGKSVVKTIYRYNPTDHTLTSVWRADGTSERFTYNADKQVVTATDTAGHQLRYGYDSVFANQDTVTAPGSRTTTVLLDAYGRDSVVSAPTLAAVTTVYDVLNRPTQVIQAGRPATMFGYDALFPTDLTDANGNHTHTDHNAVGWPTARQDAAGATEYFYYDLGGNQTGWKNRRGDLMRYSYDGNGRLLSRSGRGVSDTYSYSDDAYWGDIAVDSNAVETDSVFHRPLVQDVAGADSTVIHLNGVRYTIHRPYAGALNVARTMSITHDANSAVQFANRSVSLNATTGLVSQVQDGVNTATPGYDGEALLSSLSNPAFGAEYSGYTSLHLPDSAAFSASSLQQTFGRRYYYDAAGRLSTAVNAGAAAKELYQYDQYGELQSVSTQAECAAQAVEPDNGVLESCALGLGSSNYTYDNVGNRTDLGATYYAGNRLDLFNGGWHTYDADGNLTQKYGVQPTPHNQLFYWNAENRLDSLSTDSASRVHYEYNALGQPVKKYRNDVLDRVWLWDGDQLLAELDASNQRVAEYEYNDVDRPYAAVLGATSITAIQYQEQDALGNVEGTHTGTTVSETISYDPWGAPSYSGDLSNRLMWKGLLFEGGPGQTPSDVVGLYYMRGRWYDPQVGRFIQEDPIHSGVNDYTFANDDPVNGWDPSGMCTEAEAITITYSQNESGHWQEDLICPGVGGGETIISNTGSPISVTPAMPSIPVPGPSNPNGPSAAPGASGGGGQSTKPVTPIPVPNWRSAKCVWAASAFLGATLESVAFLGVAVPALTTAGGAVLAGEAAGAAASALGGELFAGWLEAEIDVSLEPATTLKRLIVSNAVSASGAMVQGKITAHELGEGTSFADLVPVLNFIHTGRGVREHCYGGTE